MPEGGLEPNKKKRHPALQTINKPLEIGVCF